MSWETQMDHQDQDQDHLRRHCHGDGDDDDFEEESSTSGDGASTRRRQLQQEQVLRWDKFLPKGSLTVLLLEGDDSTRHVIAALLRKCNYKVAAVSDGLKAWEILKERPESIDVVLAEVEVPSVSGINLLSMIMEHEICKNIPVIMMSSHDSINMVFKCMLKGAADFLVKPIRRNELRNLWQHVWRRHTSRDGNGGTKLDQDDNPKKKLEATSLEANQLNGFVPSVKNNKECSQKGSDAEVSASS